MLQPLDILYKDDYLIAVNKPAGMLVHRSWLDKHETQFVMQTLRDQIGQHVFPLHRLDRPTSGVLLFALSKEVASQLMPFFAEHRIDKTYLAIVRGWMEESGRLEYPLKVQQDKIADKFASQDKEPQQAITDYRPIAKVEIPYSTGRFETSRYSLMELSPLTGRKHQLRRHMKHLKHPIVGDTSHGDGKHNRLFREQYACQRLLLHAAKVEFEHPLTGVNLVIEAPLDDVWKRLIDEFSWSKSIERWQEQL